MVAIKLNFPLWIEEIANPKELFLDSMISTVLAKVHEHKSEQGYYENKYKTSFQQFEKKIKSAKKESFVMYDDYIMWKSAHLLYKKWLQRYNKLTIGRS